MAIDVRRSKQRARAALLARFRGARVTWVGAVGAVELVALDTGARHEPAYVLIDEAIDLGAVVREVGDGEVARVLIANPLAVDVLVLDGDLLLGGRKDRVANATVLVPAGASAVLLVSCVEAHRWGGATPSFRAAAAVSPGIVRRGKARSTAQRARRADGVSPDQGTVWNDVAAYHVWLSAHSPTGTIADAYAAVAAEVEAAARALEPPAGVEADAIALAMEGRVVSLDALESPTVLRRAIPRMVRAHALDAVLAARMRRGAPPAEPGGVIGTTEAVAHFLEAVASLGAREMAVGASPGRGVDLRLVGPRIVGSGLLDEGRLVALAAFPAREELLIDGGVT